MPFAVREWPFSCTIVSYSGIIASDAWQPVTVAVGRVAGMLSDEGAQLMASFDYDEIGYWSELKLDVVRKYAAAYAAIMHAQPTIRRYLYVDAFAGSGLHISKRTRQFVKGSPLNALAVEPPFSAYHFVDMDGGKAAELRRLTPSRTDVFVYEGDANQILLDRVFARCKYEDYSRALCLLDPYALNVDWRVLREAGKMRTIDVFYNFMIMDANRNILWRNPDRVSAAQAKRMDRAWGSHSWREAAYVARPNLWGEVVDEKAGNEQIAEAFRLHLQKDAGFAFVAKPMPMRNAHGAVVYYLFFASPNRAGAGIVEDIFDRYRARGMR